MFTKSEKRLLGYMTAAMMLSSILTSCTSERDTYGLDDDVPIKFLVADDIPTRGAYQSAKQMTEYSIYSFNVTTGRSYVANAVQTKQADETWKSSRAITFPGKNALNFFALKPGFKRGDVENLTMTVDEKSFVHTLPNVNGKQTDFMISSLFGKTKENTGGVVLFKFKHLFSYLRFQGKCSVEGLNVKVRSFTIHNIKSTGKFTFSTTAERDGSWELQDDLDNYTFLLPEEKDLTNKKAMLHTADSMLFVMSQTPQIFSIVENTSFADADVEGNKKAYLEIECRLWKMKDDGAGGEVPDYIGCSETTWAKVYYPLAVTTKWQTASSPFSGTYNVVIDFTGGYDYDGEDFLKKHTSGAMRMVSIEPVTSEFVVDPWADDPDNWETFDM